MNLQARFGAAQTNVGYQFYDNTGMFLASRVTAGIITSPEAGAYFAPNVTPPVGAVGVYWDTDEGAEASELLAVYNGPTAEEIADAVEAENGAELAAIQTAVDAANDAIAALPTPTDYSGDLSAIQTAVDAANDAIAALPTPTDYSTELTNLQSGVDAANDAIAALPTPTDYSGDLSAIQTAVDAANTTLDGADTILFGSEYIPSELPVLIIPQPDPDGETLSVVYAYTENIVNEKRAGIVFKFRLLARTARSERILETAPQSSPPTDANGYTQITLQRNQEYRVHCKALGLVKTFTPTTETFDLLTII
jgi:hypothetical protein